MDASQQPYFRGDVDDDDDDELLNISLRSSIIEPMPTKTNASGVCRMSTMLELAPLVHSLPGSAYTLTKSLRRAPFFSTQS